MEKHWHEKAWDDYLYWQTQDKKTVRKINALIKEIERSEGKPAGKAELLTGSLSGWRSVRIDSGNRIIYRVLDGHLQILSCRGHYVV
ncbi:MAG: Txe/YoeB family addiction module toxin [Coriobacteriia bacterium]|nr:Txe/YoeB family addiction module toxin [Coriobacteriia bacterium]